MKAGKYNSLPEPFNPKTDWDVPYSMQLAAPPVGDTWHIVKHFIFEDKQRMDHIENRLVVGVFHCPCWWSANPFGLIIDDLIPSKVKGVNFSIAGEPMVVI